MHKTHKRKLDLRLLRLSMTFGGSILTSVFAYAEDLKTLDGKTFTNITEITKYPKQVYFTSDSNRIGVAVTNLPEDFRSKHGITALSKTDSVSTVKTNLMSPDLVDSILSQHKDSVLQVDKFIQIAPRRDWTIRVTTKYINLISHDGDDFDEMKLQIGQEDKAQQLFNKFLEWESIASKNNVESFEKSLPFRYNTGTFCIETNGESNLTFVWNKDYTLGDKGSMYFGKTFNPTFEKQDVIKFQELLRFLPDLKMQLAQTFSNEEAQKDLFK